MKKAKLRKAQESPLHLPPHTHTHTLFREGIIAWMGRENPNLYPWPLSLRGRVWEASQGYLSHSKCGKVAF